MYAGTSAGKALEVVDLILAEFRKLKQDAAERGRAETRQGPGEGQHPDGAGELELRAWRTWRGRRCTSAIFSRVDEMIARIDEVTAEQVQAMAQRLFEPERIAVTLLGRLDGVKLTRERLVC